MPAPRSLLKGFEKVVAATKADATRRQLISDPDTRGLYLRVMPSGHKSYTVVARNPGGKQIWTSLGDCANLTLAEARSRASGAVSRIKAGQSLQPEAAVDEARDSFQSAHDSFITRYVERQGLRSEAEIKRIFRVYVLPAWKELPMQEIGRGDVSRLLDRVEDENGPVMADRTLAALSKMFNWHASRDDRFSSPIVRGMKRSNSHERKRKRILTDAEIRMVWTESGQRGAFGDFLRIALLTAQRKTKVSDMRWSDIDNEVWNIPAEPGEKTNAGRLRLPRRALEIIETRPRIADNPFVFAGRGVKPISGFSKCKRSLDLALAAASARGLLPDVEHWILHDLRRTAKVLMARAGVRREISERVLGHTIPGVEGVYDHHDYFEEKAEALCRLDEQIASIISGRECDR